MFIVARMLATEVERVVATKMFREIVEMSRGMSEIRGLFTRALWFLTSMEKFLEKSLRG